MIEILDNFIKDPYNARYNFTLGKWYDDQGHTAAAISFYLRCAEFATKKLLTYEALIRAGRCFMVQGNRYDVTTGLFQRAIALCPERPEALFLLCKFYQDSNQWHDSYYLARIGEVHIKEANEKLLTNVGYDGLYTFTFERAVCAWWLGLYDEAMALLKELRKNPEIAEIYRHSIDDNISRLENNWRESMVYDSTLYDYLRLKFEGAKEIENNYSQCYQDIFVLTMLNGKKGGKFLEIGCGEPYHGSNTALLERFGWSGCSIDNDEERTKQWDGKRTTKPITADALSLNYEKLLGLESTWDYLQIDLAPPSVSYDALTKIPLEKYKFAVITFEHDEYYNPNGLIRDKSRRYLRSFGYVLIAGNIAPDRWSPFEDWWVHPDLVDKEIISIMARKNDDVIKADEFILEKIY